MIRFSDEAARPPEYVVVMDYPITESGGVRITLPGKRLKIVPRRTTVTYKFGPVAPMAEGGAALWRIAYVMLSGPHVLTRERDAAPWYDATYLPGDPDLPAEALNHARLHLPDTYPVDGHALRALEYAVGTTLELLDRYAEAVPQDAVPAVTAQRSLRAALLGLGRCA